MAAWVKMGRPWGKEDAAIAVAGQAGNAFDPLTRGKQDPTGPRAADPPTRSRRP